jgi:hypothetical protein
MVSPASFAFDTQTASSNKFQVRLPLEPAQITAKAMNEFSVAVATLRAEHINVVVHEGDADENKPSAVFPNNWITTWPDGRVFTYPMATASRRTERDAAVIRPALSGKHRRYRVRPCRQSGFRLHIRTLRRRVVPGAC